MFAEISARWSLLWAKLQIPVSRQRGREMSAPRPRVTDLFHPLSSNYSYQQFIYIYIYIYKLLITVIGAEWMKGICHTWSVTQYCLQLYIYIYIYISQCSSYFLHVVRKCVSVRLPIWQLRVRSCTNTNLKVQTSYWSLVLFHTYRTYRCILAQNSSDLRMRLICKSFLTFFLLFVFCLQSKDIYLQFEVV